METGLVKSSDLRAATFNSGRSTKQVDIIVNLIKSSIEGEKKIDSDDIISAYIDWVLLTGKQLKEQIYNGWNWRENGYSREYTYQEVSREKYSTLWSTKTKARQWFRSNLGSAIIQGKLLAIPVIEI